MVERIATPDPAWTAVDAYIGDKLLGRDDALAATLAANAAAGLPDIDVSPAQGRMLTLLAAMAGARQILEIGTLGGYSTICLARALPQDGRLVTLEIDPHHAAVARGNVAAAGLVGKVEVRTGAAIDTLDAMIAADEGPFDFVFVDADKENGVNYVEAAIALGRPGMVIVVDNVVREGGVLDPQSDDPRINGTRALFDMISADPRLTATAVQTVGAKKWDGFLLAMLAARR